MNDITRQNCILLFMLFMTIWKTAELIFWIVEILRGCPA